MTTTDLILFYLDDRFHFLQVSREMRSLAIFVVGKINTLIRYERAMAQRLLFTAVCELRCVCCGFLGILPSSNSMVDYGAQGLLKQ